MAKSERTAAIGQPSARRPASTGWAGALVACTVLALGGPGSAVAWGEPGHRIVAELAERQLTPSTRARVLALLADEADSLAAVASWADRVRDEEAYAWSRPLHFVNLDRDCSFDRARHCAGGDCIVGAIERFRSELADPAADPGRRREALKFLVHFVGDLHQPLHAGFADDRGGNLFQVQLAGRGTNLHAVWDRALPAHRGLPADAHAALLATRSPAPRTLDPAAWARESCALIGDDGIYPPRRRIDAAYLERHLPRAESQLQLAGVRLAALLEQALGD